MKKIKRSNWTVEEVNDQHITLRDLGPWDEYMTITNDIESVIKDLSSSIAGRRVFYYNNNEELNEVVIKNGEFSGFYPVEVR